MGSDPENRIAWKALEAHARGIAGVHLRELLTDAERAAALTLEQGDLYADFSRARATTETLDLLANLADECGLGERIEALFRGDTVNNTEHRAALHTSLRAAASEGIVRDGDDIAAVVEAERDRFLAFADSVRNGERLGHSGKPFRTIINIGIGGSDLGPRFVAAALSGKGDPDVRFVASLDGMELRAALDGAEPDTTLFIICSKTFTTLETLTNATAARAWLLEQLPEQAIPDHVAAVSVNTAAMDEFGVAHDARFVMWDWVGGRYSVWSPVGLSLAIAIGSERFRAFLAGAAEMDRHFRSAPIAQNIPALHGLLTLWQQNFLGLDQHVVLPYDERLTALPDYLQQLWMESLGKSVDREGRPLAFPTGASLWGNGGSCAQHSFAQWLHQGSATAVVDYIGTANGPDARDADAHLQSLANLLAQAEVLALGRQRESDDPLEAHKEHPGNRPSHSLLLRVLNPASLGMLLALYEHSVYVQSCIWDINPFDQYGVEQGKRVARSYADRFLTGAAEDLPPLGRRILDWRNDG